MEPGGQCRIRRLPGDDGQVPGEFRPAQPVQADPPGLGPAGQLSEGRGNRRIRRYLLLTEGHHEQHRGTPGFAHEMTKQQQRRRVGPVSIIQHDHQAPPARRGPQE